MIETHEQVDEMYLRRNYLDACTHLDTDFIKIICLNTCVHEEINVCETQQNKKGSRSQNLYLHERTIGSRDEEK